MILKKDKTLFSTPFSKKYWRLAASEFSDVTMIAVAALIIALRIAVKSIAIPLPFAPNLRFTFDFIVNSVGSMVYGPLVALAVGAISDTLGFLLFPSGAYFFPYIFLEMSSGFIFGLYLYRAKLTAPRIILSRFTVTFVCNLIISPAIMTLQKYMIGQTYKFITLARVLKSTAEFPYQSVVLILWLGLTIGITDRLGLTYSGRDSIKPTIKNIVFVGLLTVFAVAAIVGYLIYKGSIVLPFFA